MQIDRVRPSASPTPVRQPAPAKPVRAAASNDTGVGASSLSPEDQQAYGKVWQAASAEGRAHLMSLLKAGMLSRKDSQGQSLVANLAALSALKPPAGAPYKAGDILAQTLTHLVAPEVINQSSRNTCGATTLQTLLITQQPAEYARLVAGIAGPGTIKTQAGGDLVRVADSVASDDTDRDDVERLMQSAIQDYGFEARGRYSNVTDEFRIQGGDGLFGKLKSLAAKPVNWFFDKVVDGDVGIAEGKVAQGYRDLLGKPAKLVGDLPGGQFLSPGFLRRDVYDQVAAAVKAGKPVPVDILMDGLMDKPGEQKESVVDPSQIGYFDKMRGHQVLVNRIENGRVYYRNPWGYQTSMSEREFKSRLTDGIIPQ